jgi:hypothetical protein
LTWFDRQGHELATLGPEGQFFGVLLSPDGRRVLANSWLLDAGSAEQVKLPSAGYPLWSRDGSAIRVQSAAADTVEEHPLANLREVRSAWQVPKYAPRAGLIAGLMDAAPAGTLGYDDGESFDIVRPGAQASEAIHLPVPPGETIVGGRLSPDGRWLLYTTNGIYLQAVAAASLRRQISPSGSHAVWHPDGKEILLPRLQNLAGARRSPRPSDPGCRTRASFRTPPQPGQWARTRFWL